MPLLPFPLFLHSSFAVYDADSYAPCRYHLLPRVVPPPVLLLNGSVTSSPLPGTAARWRLPADSSGLNRHAQMVHRVNTMYQTYTLYYFLQVRDVRGTIVFRSSFRNFPCRNSYLAEHEFPLHENLRQSATPHLLLCRASSCSCSSCTSSTQSASSHGFRLFQVGNGSCR